jgi:TPR repeat protein
MKIFKTISLVLAVAFTSMSVHGALAQDFDKGLAAAQSGDFATALKEWRPLAEQGDADAQSNLGVMYYNGNGVPQDYAQAVKWYRKAAEQGHADAQSNLGVMYDKGEGVPQDYAQAVKWALPKVRIRPEK